MKEQAQLVSRAGALGRLEIIAHRGKTGLVERFIVDNIWVDGGLGYIAARCAGEAVNPISHMSAGTSATGAAGTDLSLGAEIAGARRAVTISGTGAERTYSAVFPAGVATGPWREAGLFNAAASGLMTNRTVFGAKTKDPEDVFTINWTLRHVRS